MLILDVGGASIGAEGPEIARRDCDCHCERRDVVGAVPKRGRKEQDEDAVSGLRIDRHSDGTAIVKR